MPAHVAADVMPVGTGGRALVHQPAAAHHHDAVGHMQQFIQVLADHQHRRALVARGHQPGMHLGHGGEVQAEHRVADQQHLGIVAQLTRQHRALHIAARQRADGRALALGLDAVAGDQAARPLRQRAWHAQAGPGKGWHIKAAQTDVVGHAHAGHAGIAQRLLGQAAHLEPTVLRPGGGVGLAVDGDAAAGPPALAGQGFHHLALAVARDPGHADDFTGVHRQVQPVHGGLAPVAQHRQAVQRQPHRAGRGGVALQGVGLGAGSRIGGITAAGSVAHHAGRQLGRLGTGHRAAGHQAAPAQHGHIVGKGHHLAELVGDHHHAAITGMGAGCQRAQHLVGLLRREHAGGLIQDQQARLQEQLLQDLQLLLLASRQLLRRGVQVQLEGRGGHEGLQLGAHPLPVDHGGQGASRDQQVLGHRHARHHGEVLVDHADAQRPRHGGGMDVVLAAVQQHRAVVGPVVADDALDQRALAGAVLAQQRMHGAGPHCQAHVAQRGEGAEALGQPHRLQRQRAGGLHRVIGNRVAIGHAFISRLDTPSVWAFTRMKPAGPAARTRC